MPLLLGENAVMREQVEETSAAVAEAAGVPRRNHCPPARCCPGSNRMDLAGSRDFELAPEAPAT